MIRFCTNIDDFSFTEDRKLIKSTSNDFNPKTIRRRENEKGRGGRREEAKPCTFLNRSKAIGSSQNSLSSKIKDSIRKTSGIPSHLASSASVRRANTNLERGEIFLKNRNVSILETRAQRQYHPGISNRRDLIMKRVHCSTWFSKSFD